MERYCINCIYEREPAAFEPCLSCYPNKKQNFIQKPMTNADKIRQMSDEELADYFAKFETKCYKRVSQKIVCDTVRFAEQHLDWLKQEVESDGVE